MPKKSRKNVGLIGLGIIGSRVANALRVGGFHVYVWNRTPRAAPNFLASPRQVAELCDIIQIFVSDAQALFDVLDAMAEGLTPSHVILCNSTVGPEATIEASRLVQERGAQFLDAPFTGSKAAAEQRELVYYIGGEDKALQTVEPVLKASSKAIVKIGKIGDAAIVKIATNMIAAVTVQTLAEAYAIVKGSGIAPVALREALKHHGVRSGVADAKLTKILDSDYEPHFSLKHMFKDVQLGIHIANSLDIDLPATTSTAGVMYGGLTRGWADLDFSVLGRSYQKEEQPVPLYAPPAPQPEEKAAPAPSQPAADAPTPGPAGEKKQPPRESTVDELRDVGITVPDAAAPPVAEKAATPAPAEPPKAEPPKAEPPKAEPPKAEPLKVEEPKAVESNTGPAKPEGLVIDAVVEKSPEAPPGAGADAKPAEAAKDTNGVPEEPGRPHTPFVRIRRWFGTGSPN